MLALTVALAACADDPEHATSAAAREPTDAPIEAWAATQWKLPKALKEISGLALSADERLFAVADEQALIFELDYARGELVKIFAVGDPTLEGDFEGIAAAGGELHLITSAGELISFSEGADGSRVPYRSEDTGAGAHCEVEGLDYDARFGFVIACKKPHQRARRDRVLMYTFADGQLKALADLDGRALGAAVGEKHFEPSGVVVSDSRVLLVAARQTALAELGVDGTLHAVHSLKGKRHRQTEGIEVTTDLRILLGDEGAGKRATLSVYVRP